MSKKLKILLIEDCDKDAELALRNLGKFEVTHVSSLKTGIAKLESEAFDCVLLDLHMVNGKKETIFYEVKMKCGKAAIVVLTGDLSPRTRDHLLYVGANAFMVKGKDDKTREDMEWCIFRALEHREGKQ